MSYLLFLDDIRDPSWVHWCTMPRVPDSDWAIVRNHDQFVALVEREGIPALVAFDHDLDAEGMLDESRNGMDCLQWLWQHCQQQNQPFPPYVVHSHNGPRRQEMEVWLYNRGAGAPWDGTDASGTLARAAFRRALITRD